MLDSFKNINFIETYKNNKKTFFFCFFIILFMGDLSLIPSLYFMSLIYMTVKDLGGFYNQVYKSTQDIKSKKANFEEYIETFNAEKLRKFVIDFSILFNNWLAYSSLVLIDWIFHTLIYLIGSSFGNIYISNIIIKIIRTILYMQYCKHFIKSLKPYRERSLQTDETFISDELSKCIGLSSNVKHLMNFITLNNVFCFNFFVKINFEVLTFIDSCSSTGIDVCTVLSLEGTKHISKIKNIQDWVYNYPNYSIQNIKSYLFGNDEI